MNSDDVSVKTINENLEVQIKDEDLEHTQRIGKTKMNNNKNNPQPITIKFARDSYRKKDFQKQTNLKEKKLVITKNVKTHIRKLQDAREMHDFKYV